MLTLESSRAIPSGKISFHNGLPPRIEKDSSKDIDETVISSCHQHQKLQKWYSYWCWNSTSLIAINFWRSILPDQINHGGSIEPLYILNHEVFAMLPWYLWFSILIRDKGNFLKKPVLIIIIIYIKLLGEQCCSYPFLNNQTQYSVSLPLSGN